MRLRRTLPLALSASLVLLSCRSFYDDIAAHRGTETAVELAEAADRVELGIQQLNATVAALHAIVESPAADLAAQRRMFEEALGGLMSTGEDVRDAAADIMAEGPTWRSGTSSSPPSGTRTSARAAPSGAGT